MVNHIVVSTDDENESSQQNYSLSKLNDTVLRKVTVRSKKQKRPQYKPNISIVVDETEKGSSDDFTHVEKSPQKLYIVPKSSSVVPLNRSHNFSINVSSDEDEPQIEINMSIPKHARKSLSKYKSNVPKINLNFPSIPVDSESSLNEPENNSKQLKQVGLGETSDEEGFVFTTPKKAQTSFSKNVVKANEISTKPSSEKPRSKNKTRKDSLSSVEKSGGKVPKSVEKANRLGSPTYRLSLFRELPNISPESTSYAKNKDVELAQPYLENQDKPALLSTKKKHKNKERNDSHVEEEIVNIDSMLERSRDKNSDPEVKTKSKHKKKSKIEEDYLPTQSKVLDEAGKKKVASLIKNPSVSVTKNQKKKPDEIDLLQIQLINKVMKELHLKNNNNNDGSNKNVLEPKPTSPVKQPKKRTPKKKSEEFDDMARKLLAKTLKTFDTSKKSQPDILKDAPHKTKRKIRPSKPNPDIPNLNGPSSSQSPSKEYLQLSSLDHVALSKPVKSKKDKKIKVNPSTDEDLASDQTNRITMDSVGSISVNSQNLPEVKRKKRNKNEKETTMIEKRLSAPSMVEKYNVDSEEESHIQALAKPVKKKRKHNEKKDKNEEINKASEGAPSPKKKKKRKDIFETIAAELVANALASTK